MKAIETNYKGYKFRSRLEARWAVFFDYLRVEWRFETEGFESPEGVRYLPDFFLPKTNIRHTEGIGCFIEIKPKEFKEDFKHGEWFGNLVLFQGEPKNNIWECWNDDEVDDYGSTGTEYVGEPSMCDFPMLFWVCEKCRKTKIEFAEGSYNYCSQNCDGNANVDLLRDAAFAARSARFEFGRSGSTL